MLRHTTVLLAAYLAVTPGALQNKPKPTVAVDPSGGWRANPDVVARASTQRPDTNDEEARVTAYTLPDRSKPGQNHHNGGEMEVPTRGDLELFRPNVYGRVPGLTGIYIHRREEKIPAMGGAATLRG